MVVLIYPRATIRDPDTAEDARAESAPAAMVEDMRAAMVLVATRDSEPRKVAGVSARREGNARLPARRQTLSKIVLDDGSPRHFPAELRFIRA